MSGLTVLEGVELVPVVELAPTLYAKPDRPLPSGGGPEERTEWHRYWLDSLEDSGIVGLTPLLPGSWLVPTRWLVASARLERVLTAFLRARGGAKVLSGEEHIPILEGGLALRCNDDVLVTPTCCGDLGNLSEWRGAAEYRQHDWKI